MGKINLVILDGDARYMENLAGYVTEHYRHRFNLYTFTCAEALVDYVRSAGADIVLIGAEEHGEWISRLESGLIILLSSGAPSGDAAPDSIWNIDPTGASRGAYNIGNIERVDRYCGADKLVSDILKIYSKNDRPVMDTDSVYGGRENKIIAVFSAEGGSGRTSVAIALCSHFAKLKYRTIYIGLDLLGAGDFAFEGDKDGGLSDIIYTIKTRPDRLGIKFEALSKSVPGCGFYYFAPPLYPMDIDEIQPSDIEALIARLRGAGLYDRIVIDTYGGLSLKNKALMELIDGIYIIASGGGSGYKKLMLFKEQIDRCFSGQASDIYRRSHIIVNCARIKDARLGAAVHAGNAGDARESGNTGDARYTGDAGIVKNSGIAGNTGITGIAGIAWDARIAWDAGIAGIAGNAGDLGNSGDHEADRDLVAKTEEIASAFSAKVTNIPFCAVICDEYNPESLADMSNAFGAALAEVARRA